MNATFILISAACLAGAEPAPAAPAAPAPAVVASAPGCGGCDAAPSCGSSCGHHISIFDKLKARLHCHKSSCCAPAPSCAPVCAPKPVACAPACAPAPCAPACKPACHLNIHLFHGFTTSACGCGTAKIGLFDRLRARFHHSSCSSPCTSGCSTGPAMVAPMTPVAPPKEMPPAPKDEPKKTTLAPIAPLTPADAVRIPEFGGTVGKY